MTEREGRDVFLLGAANVGKSAFLKSLLPLVSPAAPRNLPISASTPGTTLSLLPIDCFSGGSQLYDTPGDEPSRSPRRRAEATPAAAKPFAG